MFVSLNKVLPADSILGRIVARTRSDLEHRMERVPLASLEVGIERSHRDFAAALKQGPLGLIAEFKPRSPSRGEIRPGAQPADIVPVYGRYASAISVLCDEPHFGGGYALLAQARALVDCPLLAKDFVISPYQVFEARRAGADAILLMASVLDDPGLLSLLELARSLGMEPLVETHDEEEQARVLDAGARVVGVNSRDLRTLKIDLDEMHRRLEMIPDSCVRVAESGVSEAADVERLRSLADAVLIGSRLMGAEDIAQAIEELGWVARK